MTRSEAWIHFASAAMANGHVEPQFAAANADQMMMEYDKRFPNGDGYDHAAVNRFLNLPIGDRFSGLSDDYTRPINSALRGNE